MVILLSLVLTAEPAPRFSSAPAEARGALSSIWTAAGNKEPLKALRPLMETEFTWSFGGDADATQAITEWEKDATIPAKIRAAAAGKCTSDKSSVTCAAKTGPRLVLEKKGVFWRWTAFVEGD